MSRGRETLALGVAGVLVAALGAPAAAETRTGFAAWEPLVGAAGSWTSQMTLTGTGFPAADVTSDSRGGTAVGVQSGQSTWFGPSTPPGQAYGSSRDLPYLGLRPLADNAGSPSTTTYTFERPAPLGWAFVLGDIDSDEVTVSATLADGSAASVADLGFEGAFSFCGTEPDMGSCPGPVPGDVPTWDAATATLTGNPAATDTVGAAGWFRPTASLATLTLTFRRRAGFPVYQAWFMSRTQDVSGTVVSDPQSGCDVTTTELRLTDPDGTVLATTTPAPDGSWAFPGVAATDTFSVVAVPGSPDCRLAGPDEVSVDLRTTDDTADFELAAVPPATAEVTGQVVDEAGDPVADADLVLTDEDATVVSEDTTGAAGGYDLGPVPPGDYRLAIEPPDGFSVVGPDTVPVTVRPDGTLDGEVDFVLRADTPDSGTPGTGQTPTVPTVIPSGR